MRQPLSKRGAHRDWPRRLHLRRGGLGPTAVLDYDARTAIRLEELGLRSHRFFAADGSWNIALQADGAHEQTTFAI